MAEVNLSIPQELINGLVVTEVAKVLNSSGQLVEEIVRAILTKPVDNYSRETFVMKAFREQVQTMVAEVVKEVVVKRRDAIRRQLIKQLSMSNAAGLLADGLLDGVKTAVWSVNVNFLPRGNDRG